MFFKRKKKISYKKFKKSLLKSAKKKEVHVEIIKTKA